MIEAKDPPVCSDCLHYYSDRQHCAHPDVKEFDPIHGRLSQWVRTVRDHGGACGREGKLFTPIPPATTMQIARRWAVVVGILLVIFAAVSLR